MDEKKRKRFEIIVLLITFVIFTLLFRNWDAVNEFFINMFY